MTGWPSINFWLDLNVEVAPYKVIPSQFRRKKALVVGPAVTELWQDVDDFLPFHARQNVSIDASITSVGMLTPKILYSLRRANQPLLPVPFHHSPNKTCKHLT